ncbi:MAG: threonine/serine exporter family protein [Kofleriaceae bacterium]|nr:threonine/serine exporter family protein [Kofleriaceae bacterium]
MVVPEQETEAIEFILALGKALHRYGTAANRLEEDIREVSRRLGLKVEVFTTPTTLIMSFGEPAELRTRMERVEAGELDLGKLGDIDDLVIQVARRELTPVEGMTRLQGIIDAPSRYGYFVSTLSHAVTAGSFTVFFGGSPADVATSAMIGLLLGLLAQLMKRSFDQAHVFELVGAAVAAFAAGVTSSLWSAVVPPLVTAASLILLLPGMQLTTAITELATRNLIAGTARLMFAVIVLLQLVVGVFLGERLANAVVDVHQAVPLPIAWWMPWAALVTASLGVTVLLRATPRAFGWILLASLVAYLGTRAGSEWLGKDMGVLIGAFALGVLGNLYSRWLQRPAQVVVVPAMLLLVPGSLGFRAMSSLLGRQTLTGVETMFIMFVVAIAIVAGLLVANAVISPRRA